MEDSGRPEKGNQHPDQIERLGPSHLEQVAEALIFAADEPLPAAQIARVYSDVSSEALPDKDSIELVVDSINAWYDLSDRSFRIQRWAGGYRIATVPAMAGYVEALLSSRKKRKLTRSLLETIAIVAYQAPTTRSSIEFVRGVDSDYSIRRLLEYGLIDVVGRSEGIGRPLLYGTTDRFLEMFGLNSTDDLPNMREIESILDDPAFQKEKAKLLMTSGLAQVAPESDTDDAGSETNGIADPDENSAQDEISAPDGDEETD
jgi:segregation and condensation protein B